MTEHSDLAVAARRHGLSEAAAAALYDALVYGGGRMAQFSHPDLGGMGQWSGGMTQIGDMFNDSLKAKVSAFCADMAAQAGATREGDPPAQRQSRTDGIRGTGGLSPWGKSGDWWPAHLGRPSSSGSQNGMSYAFFPDECRLAIARGGTVTLYDTGEHRLGGFSQQQSHGSDLFFSGQNGPIALRSLRIVDL